MFLFILCSFCLYLSLCERCLDFRIHYYYHYPFELLPFGNICRFSLNVFFLRSCIRVFVMGVEYNPLCAILV